MAVVAVGGVVAAGLVGMIGSSLRSQTKFLRDSVDDVIQNAINAGSNSMVGLVTHAGDEVIRVIDHFEDAYRRELDYSLNQVSAATQSAFNQLVSVVDKFTAQTTQTLEEAMQAAQQFALTLPWANTQSQLTSVKPRYFVVTDLASKSIIVFRGVFPWAAVNEGIFGNSYIPTLSFSGTSCDLLHSTGQELQFEIPHSIFDNLPANKQFSRATGQLYIPWKDTSAWVWAKVDSFHQITLFALPCIAGTITEATFISTANIQTRNVKQITDTQTVKLYNTSHANKYPPDAGYEYDTTKAPQISTSPQPSSTAIDYTKTIFSYAVYSNNKNWTTYTSTVKLEQIKTSTQQNQRVEPTIELKWGEQKLLQPKAAETLTKFTFEDCTGRRLVFSSPFLSQGILNVEVGANGIVKLKATIPTDVNQFMNQQ